MFFVGVITPARKPARKPAITLGPRARNFPSLCFLFDPPPLNMLPKQETRVDR